jgi:hypothetical protein
MIKSPQNQPPAKKRRIIPEKDAILSKEDSLSGDDLILRDRPDADYASEVAEVVSVMNGMTFAGIINRGHVLLRSMNPCEYKYDLKRTFEAHVCRSLHAGPETKTIAEKALFYVKSALELTNETLRLILCAKFPSVQAKFYLSTYSSNNETIEPYYSKIDLVAMFLTTYAFEARKSPAGIYMLENLVNGNGPFSRSRLKSHARNMSDLGCLAWYYYVMEQDTISEKMLPRYDTELGTLIDALLSVYTYDNVAAPFLHHFGFVARKKDNAERLNTIRSFMWHMTTNSPKTPIAAFPVRKTKAGALVNSVSRYNEDFMLYPRNILWMHSIIRTATFNGHTLVRPRSNGEKIEKLALFAKHFHLARSSKQGPVHPLRDTIVCPLSVSGYTIDMTYEQLFSVVSGPSKQHSATKITDID